MSSSVLCLEDPVKSALHRGREALASEQRADGSFEDHIEVGPIAVATQLLLEHDLGCLAPADGAAGLVALKRAQRSDGAFSQHPGADEGSPIATALAAAAFDVCGLEKSDPCFLGAQAALERSGGMQVAVDAFVARGEVSALYLAATGHVAPDFLPSLPLSIAVAPGLERMLDGRVHAGNLMALLVLLALGEKLRPQPTKRGLMSAMVRGALGELERQRAASYLERWQNPDGSFNQALFPTQLMTLGLSALGFDRTARPTQRALAWLQRQKRIVDGALVIQAIPNDVWSTAMAAIALAECDPDDAREDDSLGRAVRHLIDQQLTETQPRANQRKRGAKRTGGWAFQRGNPTMPDCDDAGLVLAALGAFAGEQSQRSVFRAIDDGIAWLRDMQNPDGGWAAYVWNLPGKRPGPMFTSDVAMPSLDNPAAAFSMFVDPPAELGDPATEGVTARVLWGLGACGIDRDDAMVARAIEFLRRHQCENGAFWDRWMTCYLPGTATVLIGLDAVGEDLQEPYVLRAVDWMVSMQNEDGGFGETHRAFRDPRQAGVGPSMPPVTAFVATALIACGQTAPAERAIEYLLRTQRRDGTWSSEGWVNPYVPPDTFYAYDLPARSMPLMALARWMRR